MISDQRNPAEQLSKKDLTQFFISHLHRIFCAKTQLAEKLPEIGKRAHYHDLRQAINETVEIVENQIARIREIYIHLDTCYQPESCIGLVGLLDEAFQSIGNPQEKPELKDLSILFYLQNFESIEMSSFKVMMTVAGKLGEPEVEQLLLECFDEASEDKVLLKQITYKYL